MGLRLFFLPNFPDATIIQVGYNINGTDGSDICFSYVICTVWTINVVLKHWGTTNQDMLILNFCSLSGC